MIFILCYFYFFSILSEWGEWVLKSMENSILFYFLFWKASLIGIFLKIHIWRYLNFSLTWNARQSQKSLKSNNIPSPFLVPISYHLTLGLLALLHQITNSTRRIRSQEDWTRGCTAYNCDITTNFVKVAALITVWSVVYKFLMKS